MEIAADKKDIHTLSTLEEDQYILKRYCNY